MSFPGSPPPAGYQITLRNVIGITLMTALCIVIGGVIIAELDPSIFTPQRPFADKLLWIALLVTTGVLASVGYVLGWRTSAGWGIVGLTRPHPRWILIAVATGAALFFVGERLDAAFGFGIMTGSRQVFGPSLSTDIGIVTVFAAMVVVLPLSMEMYFRGVLFNYLRGVIGVEPAIGVSAAIFAVTYYNPGVPIHMAYGVIHGAAYAVLYERSGSLWTAVAAHSAITALLLAKVAWGWA